MNKINSKSLELTKENIERLKELFPNIVTEGKIDFEMLRTVLGDEIDENNEKYQFTWNGKKNAIKMAQIPSTGTLRPCKEKSVNFDTTENLYIEGDNLEVLKQLQKTYFNKIKMIYIDPPYNTGKDFVYKDNFKNSIESYKEQTNQRMSSNPETNGRYHTDWLNMMYPRLMLAKNLLKDDGVIFLSIDDNEVHNLRKICDEIFGESNFIGDLIRKTKSTTNDNKTGFNMQHENLLIYSKYKQNVVLQGKAKDFGKYQNPDNDPAGRWVVSDPSARTGSYFEIINPYTGKIDLPPENRQWLFSGESYKKHIESGKLKFKKEHKPSERGFIFKRYLNELKSENNLVNSLHFTENGYMNMNATKLINSFFNFKAFDYTKPLDFIKEVVMFTALNSNDIVLDFFSGSATTAHAVMKLNAEDDGNLRFIMVQIPEVLDDESEAKALGYETICDIGEERIRRAGKKVKEESGKEDLDIGFKVFKLDSTNINQWDNERVLDSNTLQLEYDEVFKKDRSNDDILYEVLLKYGMFDKEVEELNINGKTLYKVGKRYMVVCLSSNIDSEDVKGIIAITPKVVVFNEEAFKTDNDKINITTNLKTHGVEEVKCI